MRVLALDLASKTGWAQYHHGEITSGVWFIAPRAEEMPGHRYRRLYANLNTKMGGNSQFDLVIYEMAHHRGQAATEYAIGCIATVQFFAARWKTQCFGLHSATIKKFTTGSGRAQKKDMIRAMEIKGHRPEDDNEADALAMLLYAKAKLWRIP